MYSVSVRFVYVQFTTEYGWLMTRAPDLDALGGRLSASCGYAAFVI